MKHKLTNELELTDERSESSFGIPVLVVGGGRAYGKSDNLPYPFQVAGHDAEGNHTGNPADKCRLAGVIVQGHAESLHSIFPTEIYEWIKSFYAQPFPPKK
jgi:hypothetical protein